MARNYTPGEIALNEREVVTLRAMLADVKALAAAANTDPSMAPDAHNKAEMMLDAAPGLFAPKGSERRALYEEIKAIVWDLEDLL